MRHPERHPQRNSDASRRNSGGGSSSGNTHRHSHQSSTSGVAALTSPPPQVTTYDPSRDPTYTQAHRSSRPDQTYLNGTASNHSPNGAPYQTHPQNQAPSFYNPPHHSWTAYSSTHLQISTYDTSGRDFYASPVFQTAPPAGTAAQPQQVPTGALLPHQTAPRRPEPYDAVGYVRSDGEVYDRDEVYEEYRPYDPYDHQRGHRGYCYGNNGTSH